MKLGRGKKLIKRPEANKRKRSSFESRYGMSRPEWAKKKKELRKAKQGAEIDKIYKKALTPKRITAAKVYEQQ